MDGDKNHLVYLNWMGKLKHLDRAGWVLKERAINKAETVAAHMYRMSVLAMTLVEDYVNEQGQNVAFDRSKVVQMCLVHDMAEAIVGDITPFDHISQDEKHRRESQAMNTLCNLVPQEAGQSLNHLYQEYENRQTVESLIVKELDLFDVMLQGYEYERQEWELKGRKVFFQEFFNNANGHIRHPQLKRMMEHLVQERHQFWAPINAQAQAQVK